MTVVVTGAAGFLGRHVTRRLLQAGHGVVGIDRRGWAPSDGETAVVADLLDPGVARHLVRADAVVHLAARPGVRDSDPDVGRLRWRDNVLAGQAVLTHTPDATPVVVASSSSVYGGAGDPAAPRACSETDPRHPRGGYARSKAVLEDLAAQRAARGGRVCVVRPFTVAGEGQRADMALARWIRAVRAGLPLTVLGGLERRRDVTDAGDVAEGVLRIVERDVVGVLNLGTGTTHSLAEMLDAVTAAVGRPAVIQVAAAGAEEPSATRADTRRCAATLGFVPTTDLVDVVHRQVAASNHPVSCSA